MISISRRGLVGLVMGAVLASGSACAQAPMAGRPQAGPLEPLQIVTAEGVRQFKVQVVDTPTTRAQGLMFVRSMPADEGMLFDFRSVQPVSFWMRNTYIPLDMLFIHPDGRVESIARNARPMTDDPVPSRGPVLAVLEINGGMAAKLGVKPGDMVRHRIFGNL